jgi:hypothetical protein
MTSICGNTEAMPNPPSIPLLPGQPQAIGVVVTANAVQPDGSNPGAADTTTPLTLENVQNASGAGAAVVPSVDPGNNRRVIMTPGVLAIGASPLPWSFRIKAAGRTTFTTVSGTTAAPLDVSGVAWDGIPPAAA